MRRSTVLIVPLLLGFPDSTQVEREWERVSERGYVQQQLLKIVTKAAQSERARARPIMMDRRTHTC